MIKRYSLFLSLIFFASCTYDYFEDETNYMVYAPKANTELVTDDYKIDDIHIYVYNDQALVNHKVKSSPFNESTRMKRGLFTFRLFPGAYDGFCFANTAGFEYNYMSSRGDAGFGLPESSNGEYRYPDSFPSLSVEFINPKVEMTALEASIDTAYFNKRYSGRICIAFRNLSSFNPSMTFDNISKVRVEATGTGTYQTMSLLTDSINTRSSSYTSSDKVMMEFTPYADPVEDYEYGIDGYFFPSLNDGRPISLMLDFIGHNGNSLHAFQIVIVETLHINQTIYLGTDGVSTMTLEISGPEQWDPGIVGGGGDI